MNVLVNNQNSETIKFLLNTGVIPSDKMIGYLCEATENNITWLNEILKYDFVKNSKSIVDIFNDFLSKGKVAFIKLIIENKTLIDYEHKESYSHEINNFLNKYVFTYQTTTNIFT